MYAYLCYNHILDRSVDLLQSDLHLRHLQGLSDGLWSLYFWVTGLKRDNFGNKMVSYAGGLNEMSWWFTPLVGGQLFMSENISITIGFFPSIECRHWLLSNYTAFLFLAGQVWGTLVGCYMKVCTVAAHDVPVLGENRECQSLGWPLKIKSGGK